MDNGDLPSERIGPERRATPRKAPAKPRKAVATQANSTVADRIDPLMHASAVVAAVEETVNAATDVRPTPKKTRPNAPRKRPAAPRAAPVVESPTAELAVFDDLLVFDEPVIETKPVSRNGVDEKALELPAAKVAEPAVEVRVEVPFEARIEAKPADDLDFFDDLDFEQPVAKEAKQRVTKRVPYVLPKIVPAEPDPDSDGDPAPVVDEPSPGAEPATGRVTGKPDLQAIPAKLKLKLKTWKPQFVRAAGATKKLARSLQPVVLPRHRPRVRRVTRVVRHIDTWSVFKIALLFNIVLYFIGLAAAVMLWRIALSTGTVENVERFFESFGWQTFELKGGEIYHNAWIAGLFGVVGLTGLAVLVATIFNLITDLVGGIRVTVLEEEVTGREPHVVTWPRLLRPATPPRREPTGEPPIN